MSHEDDPPIRNASRGLNGQRIFIHESPGFVGTRREVSSFVRSTESLRASTTIPGLSARTGSFAETGSSPDTRSSPGTGSSAGTGSFAGTGYPGGTGSSAPVKEADHNPKPSAVVVKTGTEDNLLPPEYGINTDVYDPAEAMALYLKRSPWVKRK